MISVVIPGFVATEAFDSAREKGKDLREDSTNPYRKLMFDLDDFAKDQLRGALAPDDVAAARSVAAEVRVWGVSGTPQEVRALVRRVLACGGDGMTINWPDWVTR